MYQIFTKFIFLSTLLFSVRLSATENAITLKGKLTELNMADSTEKCLSEMAIEVWSDGALMLVIYTQERGKYKIDLPFYHQYRIKYGNQDFVQKMIDVDATDFAQHTQKRGYELALDITLFKQKYVSGFEFLKETPIATASYSKEEDMVVWNTQHITQMNMQMMNAIWMNRKPY